MSADPSVALSELDDDPRLSGDFWRVVEADDPLGPVVLVGVVHDHPASSYRVHTVGTELQPDAIALELPAIAASAYDRADSDAPDPTTGGEMLAAVASDGDADVVGIDTFGGGFLTRFVANAIATDALLDDVRDAFVGVGGIVRDAAALWLSLEDPATRRSATDFEVTGADPAAEQAANERTCVSRSRSLLGALERPASELLLDETREQTMAANLRALRHDQAVLGVVGMEHLDAVAALLE